MLVLLVSTGFGVRLLLLVSDGIRLPNRARPGTCPDVDCFTIPTWQRLVYNANAADVLLLRCILGDGPTGWRTGNIVPSWNDVGSA